MARTIVQLSRDDIAGVIRKGLPENAHVFYFNPDEHLGSSGYARLYPLTATTISKAMDEEACFIEVFDETTDDDESSFDLSSDEEV